MALLSKEISHFITLVIFKIFKLNYFPSKTGKENCLSHPRSSYNLVVRSLLLTANNDNSELLVFGNTAILTIA